MPTVDYEKRLSETVDNIQQSEIICDRNQELAQQYLRDKVLDGLSEATLLKNLTRLKVISEHLKDQPLDEMDKSEVKDLVAWVHTKYDNDETIDTYKKSSVGSGSGLTLTQTGMHQILCRGSN